jgi:hypothetical protein
VTGSEIRAKRVAAGISGVILCVKADIGRTRLSGIERETILASPDEAARIETALEQLILAKQECNRLAASMGWPTAVI